jgi:hypothetical protein
LLNPCGSKSVDERTFKDSICISSSVMSLLPEPVLRLPHQLQILANLILLILTLIVSFLAVWNHQRLVLFSLSYELWKFWCACANLAFKPDRWADRIIANLIINLLPRYLSWKDFVFMSCPYGNFIQILALRAECYC